MRNVILLLAVAFLTFSSCRNGDDDASTDNQGWENTSVAMNHKILNAFAGENELLLISDTEFFRVGKSFNVLEKRPVSDLIYGRPVLSENVYAYMKKNGDFKDVVSFHLANNPDAVFEMSSDEMIADAAKTCIFETQTRTPGIFNADGTQFALPAIVYPDFNYHFFIFDIELNANKTQFIDVSVAKEVTALEMPADFGSLTNMRFIDGLFYASAYSGGYRFNDSMDEAQQLFPHWTVDFFKRDTAYYATGLFYHDFFISETGEHWQRMWHESELNNVEMVGDELFSQLSIGWPFKYVEDLAAGSEILYPASFPENNTLYYNMVKFDGNYYMTLNNELHTFGTEIPVK